MDMRLPPLPTTRLPERGRISGFDLRVLIVDDDADTSDTMAILLGHWGFEVKVARNGSQALEASTACMPDIVLLDIAMPGVNGLEVARHICKQSRLHKRRPFLIAISGYADTPTQERAQEVGIDLYLVKPVDPVEVEKVLRRFQRVAVPSAEQRFCSSHLSLRRRFSLRQHSDLAILRQSQGTTRNLIREGNELTRKFRQTTDCEQQILLRRAWCEKATLFAQEIENGCQAIASFQEVSTG